MYCRLGAERGPRIVAADELTAPAKTRQQTCAFLRCLFRPHPDEELARRVVALRAHELGERALDLGPGLLLFGAAEPSHQLAQGKRPSCVLHGLSQGRETPPGGNRMDGYLPEASRSERVL